MSKTPLTDETPSDRELEVALRHAVQVVYQTGDLEQLTVKRMRKATEEELELPEGFFKESTWKDRSKAIIENEVELLHSAAPDSSQPESANPTPVKAPKQVKPTTQSERKRPSPSDSKPGKRRKVSRPQEPKDAVSEGKGLAEPKGRPAKATSKAKSQKGTAELPQRLDSEDRVDDPQRDEETITEATPAGLDDESEMSDVIDDGPKLKGRKPRSGSGESKLKAPKQKRQVQKPQDKDSDAEEIKRLQGWLIKCGIRKMWYKELAPYTTPKAKICHLKEMLTGVGMVGRYSQEKATEIKEARELQADLEAVRDGAKLWGKEESEEEGQSKPRRRLARGLQGLDFLNDDDGEETD